VSRLDFSGRRAVVTGCASGIGLATARLLGTLGASVHGIDITASDAPLTEFTKLDLRDPEAIEGAAQALEAPIDLLCNCAGLAPGRDALDVFMVNFVGTRLLTDRLLPRMGAGAAVVNVASLGGMGWPRHLAALRELVASSSVGEALAWWHGMPEMQASAYSASKEAVFVWTMMESANVIRRGIRMNAVCPGAVQTPMLAEIEQTTTPQAIDVTAQQIGRRSTADEQAWPIAFLGSDAASYINGAVLPVDGGFFAARSVDPGTAAPIGRR
jgi:NAD(P)-dependent dehydrogenase (short-subunit alcohol dehydrogenase family)